MAKPGTHESEKCGAREGPLEDDRSAICHTCVPESAWFEACAAVQEENENEK